jgi:hypothetical protein
MSGESQIAEPVRIACCREAPKVDARTSQGVQKPEQRSVPAVAHPAYDRVLVPCRDNDARWLTVRYDAARDRAVPDREFRLLDAVHFT